MLTVRDNSIPVNLEDSNLIMYLRKLQSQFSTTESLVYDKNDVPVDQLNVAVTEFLDLVMFTSSSEHKHYILRRLERLKSVEILLDQLDSYLPIDFDYSTDPEDGLPKTDYSPRLLKVAFERIQVNNLASDFINIIDNMFNQLLYFIEYKLSINELIYNIVATLERDSFKVDVIPMKLINIEDTYYQVNNTP